jgi:hypothetical protein
MTPTVMFEKAGGQLRISRSPGEAAVSNPDGLEVARVLQLTPFSAVVLLAPPLGTGQVRNLVKVGASGEVQWRAQLPPGNATDSFVSVVTDADGAVIASTWSGYRVRISPTTGLIEESHFVK